MPPKQAVRRRWYPRIQRPAIPGDPEKQAIISACESFIRNVLKPRFLPEIGPTRSNYTIDIHGAWTGGRYRFIQRYRSGYPDDPGREFDAPFARIDRVGPDRFNIQWMRHTGRWWPVYSGVTLARALRLLESDELLHPL
jgi:hypothetical protein